MKEYQQYIIPLTSTIKDALISLNDLSSEVLTLFVLDENECLVGTITDGDIRRKLIEGYSLVDNVALVMNRKFHFLNSGIILVSEIKKFKDEEISLVPCLDENKHIVKVLNLKKFHSILPIDAVLMAGGKGERLRPLTDKIPKPLLKVGAKSIIDHNIDRLIKFGVENISVTVNYLKEQIEDNFKNKRAGVQINCVREPHYYGTIGALKLVGSFKNDSVLVMNSDLFTNINYEDFYLNFLNNDADMSVAGVPYSVNIPYGIFELNGDEISAIREKPSYNYYANAGIYLIKRKLLDLIPNDTFYNATDLIDSLIIQGYKVIRFPLTGYWIDIGKHEDFNRAQELVKHL